jgi:acyl carrier protein
MTTDTLYDEIAELVVEIGEVSPEVIGPDVAFDDVGIDSLLAIEIAVHIEKRYRTTFSETELGALHTFGDLVSLTRTHVES